MSYSHFSYHPYRPLLRSLVCFTLGMSFVHFLTPKGGCESSSIKDRTPFVFHFHTSDCNSSPALVRNQIQDRLVQDDVIPTFAHSSKCSSERSSTAQLSPTCHHRSPNYRLCDIQVPSRPSRHKRPPHVTMGFAPLSLIVSLGLLLCFCPSTKGRTLHQMGKDVHIKTPICSCLTILTTSSIILIALVYVSRQATKHRHRPRHAEKA